MSLQDIKEKYQNTKIGVIPIDWQLKKISDIANVNANNLNANTPINYQFYYYDVSAVDKGKIFHPNEKITFGQAPSRAKRIFQKNDVLMSTVRPNLQGFGYVDFDSTDCVCSTGFAVISGKQKSDSLYIYHNLFSNNITNQINKLIVGSNYPAITARDVENMQIPYPSDFNERKKISSILSTWDKAIELKEKLIEQKKEQKKGLMQKLLTGDVRLPGFKGEWRKVKLSKICTLETGKRPKGGVTTEGEIPSLGGENIYSDNGLNLTTIKKVNLEFYESMTTGQLKENDILINKDGAQTGKVALYKDSGLEKACINEHLFIVRTTKNISYKFLYYYLGSEEGQQKMKVRITSSAQPGLNSQFVKGFTLRIPVYEEQKLIGDILFSLDKELLLLKDEKTLLEKQKKGLMQLLLTGKLRVQV